MVFRRLVSLVLPASVALVAFLHAHAIGSLVDATTAPASIAPFAEARASATATTRADGRAKSAATILQHNPFDHRTTRLTELPPDADASDPGSAPPCEGVRAVASVRGEDDDASFAALDAGGRHVLRKRGGDVTDLRVVYVAADRVWLERNGVLCLARVFSSAPPATPTAPTPELKTAGFGQSALEREIASRIARTGPNEVQIDRAAVDRILEAQAELMKTPLLPEREGGEVVGFRLARVRPGSVLSALGFESGDRLAAINGIDVTSTERMFEAYARLRAGAIDRLTIHLVRAGKPMNLDLVVR
jgi:general secretion pathway protein C